MLNSRIIILHSQNVNVKIIVAGGPKTKQKILKV